MIVGFCMVHAIHAQTLIIKEKSTEEPLEWVTLGSEHPQAFTITNAKGQADISDFKGSEKIEIRKLGHKTLLTSYAEIEGLDFVIKMDPSNLNLDEVVVSATRWKQTSSDLPMKIASITREDMNLQNPQTAADLLNLSGKVFIQKSQQGGGSPMIRGFATNRLLYAIDGVRMNTAIFRGGNIQNVISLDPFAIENTEVLFGPGTVSYGSDAIGGVMSFQTLVPELSLNDGPLVFGNVNARYSSANNEKTGHFDVNVGWKKWAFVTSFSSFDYDHLRQGRHGPDDYLKPYHVQRIDSTDVVISQDDPLLQIPSGYSQMNFMQKVRFKPSENLDLKYAFHYSETSPYGRYDRHNRIRDKLPRYAEWNYGPQIWQMHHLDLTNQNSTKIYDQLSLRLAAQRFEESRIDRGFNKSDRATNEESVNAYSVNLDLIKALGKHSVNYGVEYVLNAVQSSGKITDISTETTTEGPSRYPISTWQAYGLFINDQYRINQQWLISGGIRYSGFKLKADFDTDYYPLPFTEANVNKDALTGSLGLVYRPESTWVLSTNLSTAFRSPNVDDVGKIFDSEPGAVTVPNPGLQAEYAYNFDIGLAKVIAEKVKLDMTVFYTMLDGAMVRWDYLLNGQDSILYFGEMSKVQAIQNAAKATVYGLQAGVEIQLGGGFNLSSDINFQEGEEELEDGTTSASRHAAPLFGNVRLSYRHEKLSLQAYTNFQSERSAKDLAVEERDKTEIYALDNNGLAYAPSWYTLNFKGKYKLSDFLSVSAGVENITDQRYRPYSSGLSGAGRNFVLAVKASF